MKVDVSDYLKDAFQEKCGDNVVYIKTEDEHGNPILLVDIKGLEPFEIDLDLAEKAIVDNGIDPSIFVMKAIESVTILSAKLTDTGGTFGEISKSMEMIFDYLTDEDVEFEVGDCVESESDEDMCIGLWVNIGIHPIPFYFQDAWENLISEKRDVSEYVKEVIINHVGRMLWG